MVINQLAEETLDGPTSRRARRRLPDHLPHLNGPGGTILIWLFRAFTAFTLTMLVASLWFNGMDLFRNIPTSLSYGFRTFTNTQEHHAYIENVSPTAAARGLRDRDRIVRVDATPLAPDATEYDIAAALAAAGPQVHLSVRGEKGDVRAVTLDRLDGVWTRPDTQTGLPFWLYAMLQFAGSFATPLFLFVAAALLHRRRPRDAEAMLLAGAFLCFCYSNNIMWWTDIVVQQAPALLGYVVTAGWALVLAAMCAFPDGRLPTRMARVSIFVVVVTVPLSLALEITGLNATWTDIVLPLFAITLALANLVRRYRGTPMGVARQQMRWAVLGFSIAITAGLGMMALQAVGLFGRDVTPGPATRVALTVLQFLLFTGMPAGLLISQLRYRLYDADAAISRSAAYATLTVLLLAIFTASEKIIETLGEQYFGGELGAAAGAIGAGLAAVMIVPLHHRINHWAEHRFQKNLIRLRKGLPLLVGDLRETATLAGLAEASVDRIMAGVPATGVALYIDGEPVALRGDGGHLPVTFPLVADGVGEVGQLRLGTRPDGSLYGKDEREALDEITDPLARAIAIVRQRDTAAETRAEETRTLSDRIGRLEAMIDRLLGRPIPAQ